MDPSFRWGDGEFQTFCQCKIWSVCLRDPRRRIDRWVDCRILCLAAALDALAGRYFANVASRGFATSRAFCADGIRVGGAVDIHAGPVAATATAHILDGAIGSGAAATVEFDRGRHAARR